MIGYSCSCRICLNLFLLEVDKAATVHLTKSASGRCPQQHCWANCLIIFWASATVKLPHHLPDLLLGELRQPAHAHPCLHILKLPSEHLGLPGTGAGMLHNLPQGSNQDTKEDHACQHHHRCHTLHHISWSQRTDYSAFSVARNCSSDPSGYQREPCLSASSLLPHTAPHQLESACRLHCGLCDAQFGQ